MTKNRISLLSQQTVFMMERVKRIKSETSFYILPNEILLLIFDYLSSNDIIYTFFFLTERLNTLLLQNQRYSNYLELPTTDLDTWELILSIIGPKIQCLNITTISLSFPLRYFSNLKSLMISSSYGLSEENLKYIIENDLFVSLSSFKIKQEKIFPNPYLPDNVICEDKILRKVFNRNNSLETFEYSLMIPSSVIYLDTNIFQINLNLRSLTLSLGAFRNIFVIINYTPNLKYFKAKAQIPYANEQSIEKVTIKLKQLHLTLNKLNEYINLSLLMDGIKQFSSTLVCLSLDLVDYSIRGVNEFLFDSLQLPQLLESMKELKQFHLYTKQPSFVYDNHVDLSQFKDQYWFKHNLSLGMHDDYLYTLPFYFDNLHECFQNFNDIKFHNCEILKNNSRIWSHVKSIQLPVGCGYNRNFVQELKRKMPKLALIKFDSYLTLPNMQTDCSFENQDVRLESVTTIQFTRGHMEKAKDWIIYSLPNLKHLILSYTGMPSIDSELAPILNKRIQRLDIDAYCQIEQLTEISSACFTNVQNINFYLNESAKSPEWYAEIVLKILKNFPNLKIMMIRSAHLCHANGELSFPEKNLSKIIEYFNMSGMHRDYRVDYLREYTLFSRISSQ